MNWMNSRFLESGAKNVLTHDWTYNCCFWCYWWSEALLVCVTTLVLSRITAVCKRACEFEIKHEHIHDEEHTSDRAHINVRQSSETFFLLNHFKFVFFRFSYPSNRVHLIHASLRLRYSLIPVSLYLSFLLHHRRLHARHYTIYKTAKIAHFAKWWKMLKIGSGRKRKSVE